MNAISIFKSAIHLAVSTGVGTVFNEIAKQFTPENAKTVTKICVGASTIVAGALVSDACNTYVDKTIDDMVGVVKQASNSLEEGNQDSEAAEVVEE